MEHVGIIMAIIMMIMISVGFCDAVSTVYMP
jgi:hypothetical protein